MKAPTLIALLSGHLVACGEVIWDGRFNDLESATDLDKWDWSNQVGPYQWYIHGSGPTTDYVELSPDYKNPADESSMWGASIGFGLGEWAQFLNAMQRGDTNGIKSGH